ncbi:MAG: sigma-54-dependent transcriptional regulator, partial [Vicinamibacteria bacterium]
MDTTRDGMTRVLLIEDDPAQAELMTEALEEIADKVEQVKTGAEAFTALAAAPYDLVVIDIGLPDVSGFAVLRWIRGRGDSTPIVFVTADDLVEDGVRAMREGANNYVVKRPDYIRLLTEVAAAVIEEPRRPLAAAPSTDPRSLTGTSPAIAEVRRRIAEYAPSESTVLILGETGTGKDLVAGEIHRRSRRAQGPFIAVNCAAIPEQLMESEFFGYKRGAFTGAGHDRAGYFKTADAGTLFLDEISELPMGLQGKFLRVLESGEFHPVGANEEARSDVRVIAASNLDLRQLISHGRFREDLYY